MQRKGLRNNVTAIVTDGSLAACKEFEQQYSGSIARMAVAQFLNANGYLPTDIKKAS